jgi:hypothetical protein
MNRYIKVHLLHDTIPQGNCQIYRTDLAVKVGDTVQATDRSLGVVVGFTVISEIPNPERVPKILGIVEV